MYTIHLVHYLYILIEEKLAEWHKTPVAHVIAAKTYTDFSSLVGTKIESVLPPQGNMLKPTKKIHSSTFV